MKTSGFEGISKAPSANACNNSRDIKGFTGGFIILYFILCCWSLCGSYALLNVARRPKRRILDRAPTTNLHFCRHETRQLSRRKRELHSRRTEMRGNTHLALLLCICFVFRKDWGGCNRNRTQYYATSPLTFIPEY